MVKCSGPKEDGWGFAGWVQSPHQHRRNKNSHIYTCLLQGCCACLQTLLVKVGRRENPGMEEILENCSGFDILGTNVLDPRPPRLSTVAPEPPAGQSGFLSDPMWANFSQQPGS